MGALLATAAAAGTSIINNLFQRRNSRNDARINRQFEREQSDLKWQRDIQMVDKMNLYNSPEMQMQRFKDAGLNPNLIYGQGTPGNQSSPVAYQAPKYHQKTKAMELPNIMNQYLDLKMRSAQVDNLERDTQIKEQDIINKQLQGGEITARTKTITDKNRLFNDLYDYSVDAKELDVGTKRQKLKTQQLGYSKLGIEIEKLKELKRKTSNEADIKALEKAIKAKEEMMFRKYNIHPKKQGTLRTLLYLLMGNEDTARGIFETMTKPISDIEISK